MKYSLLTCKKTGAKAIRINTTGEIIRDYEDQKRYAELRKKALQALNRAQREDAMKSLGLVKYKSSSGKVMWE